MSEANGSALLELVVSILERGERVEWDDIGPGFWRCRDCLAVAQLSVSPAPGVAVPAQPFPHTPECVWPAALSLGRRLLPVTITRLELTP